MSCSRVELQPLWLCAINHDAEPAAQLCELIAITVAVAFAVPLAELQATTRRPRAVACARQSAMYLAHVVFGLSLTEIGRAFGRDRTTASYACKKVEDRRDDPVLDAALEALEHACGALGHRLGAQARRAVLQ
jgi:chromosomal replication initiation ATPase DnaA